jgi:cob(I)alamin adenosyltransferase
LEQYTNVKTLAFPWKTNPVVLSRGWPAGRRRYGLQRWFAGCGGTGTIKVSTMEDIRRGLIMVNTGPGKGKTTAAMGTALRAVGQGMRVLMLQFLKGSWHYGELDAVQAFGDKFVMKQMGRGFVKVGTEKPDPEDVRMVEEAWAEAEKAIQSGKWDLVILDEINYAISYGMLDPAKVAESLKKRPEMVHVILTGRNAHPTIVELADTVTEMREIKHAYQKGVMAQRGIEY